jgi:hypothetical protein
MSTVDKNNEKTKSHEERPQRDVSEIDRDPLLLPVPVPDRLWPVPSAKLLRQPRFSLGRLPPFLGLGQGAFRGGWQITVHVRPFLVWLSLLI